jgi:hypothetical protein
LRQACRNSAHASLRTDRWQVSRYLRQFPSPRSPSTSLFSQARRNCSHSPPRTRTPPGPISTDWEKAETGITKRAAAAAAPNANFFIPFNIADPPVGVGLLNRDAASAASVSSRGADIAGVIASRYRRPWLVRASWSSYRSPLRRASLRRLLGGVELVPRPGTTSRGSLTFSSQMQTLKG